jgi:hypothetical protein
VSHFVSHRLSIHNESQSQGLAATRISDTGGTPSKTKEGKLKIRRSVGIPSFTRFFFYRSLYLDEWMQSLKKVTRKLGAEKVAVQDVFK